VDDEGVVAFGCWFDVEVVAVGSWSFCRLASSLCCCAFLLRNMFAMICFLRSSLVCFCSSAIC
jgi:hypothetical protein